jgi:hypothetical protein
MSIRETIQDEPAMTVAGVFAVVAATIKLVTAFGLDLTPEQITAVQDWFLTILPFAFLGAGWLIRRKVTPSV